MKIENKTPIGEEIIRNNPTGHGLFAGIGDNFNSVAQVMGSMGLVGIVAYGRLLHDRIALLREGGRDPFMQALAVSYLGMVLISLCNPGEFCPFPNAAMMVMLFAQAEEAVGDVAVPVRQLLVRHLGAPAGFLQF